MTMPGRHFLQIPGPTNVPDRVLRAMDRPTMDHRGASFATFASGVLDGLRRVFKTDGRVVIYPASGTGAWEAALVNVCTPGDAVLMYETGQFATLWRDVALRLGLEAIFLDGDWRGGAAADRVEARLRDDTGQKIKAVCIVHNETSTGATTPIADIRRAMDEAGHGALLIVDTISSLGSMEFQMDGWGVDVGVGASQKGLMLPPGLAFNAVGERAIAASKQGGGAHSYWSWEAMLGPNAAGFFPYTPATNMLYGLEAALEMLEEEGLDAVFARHRRLADAARTAVLAWGLELQCQTEAHCSDTVTAVRMPDGHSADAFRATVLEAFNMSLGNGLAKLADRVFRIGHLGDFNDLMLMGTLSGVEMGLARSGVPYRRGGAQAALDLLAVSDEVEPGEQGDAKNA